MQIILENNVTHFKRYYDDIELKEGKLFNTTELDVSNLEDGEYTLFLLNNANEIVTKELVKIGNYTKEYKTARKFIQYGKK